MASRSKILIFETEELFNSLDEMKNELKIPRSTLEWHVYKRIPWNGLNFILIKDNSLCCIKCGVALTDENWYIFSKKDNWRICKKCQNQQVIKNNKKLKEKYPFRYKADGLRHIYKGNVDSEELKEQWKSQKGCCNICNSKLNKKSFHIDHIMPVSKGGITEIDNLQFLCEMCNRGKFSWSDDEYIAHCKTVVENNYG